MRSAANDLDGGHMVGGGGLRIVVVIGIRHGSRLKIPPPRPPQRIWTRREASLRTERRRIPYPGRIRWSCETRPDEIKLPLALHEIAASDGKRSKGFRYHVTMRWPCFPGCARATLAKTAFRRVWCASPHTPPRAFTPVLVDEATAKRSGVTSEPSLS